MAALRRTLTGLAATAAALAALSGTALASSISLSNGTLNYTAWPSEANHVTFSFATAYGVYVIEDTGAGGIYVPSSAKGCHAYTAHVAYCNFGTLTSITAHLGDGGSFAESKLALTPVTLYAGAGDDTLIGGGGADTLVAGAGNDTLTAGTGNTQLVGGSGTTTMTGGSGHNTYTGGSGADTVQARNGVAEEITCDTGVDSVTADADDTAAADCETVDTGATADTPVTPPDDGSGETPTPPLGDDLPGLPAFEPPVPVVSTSPVKLTAADEVPVEVSCPAGVAGGCRGSIALRMVGPAHSSGSVTAARRVKRRALSRGKRFRIAAGEKAVVSVRLSRRGVRVVRRRLRRHKSLRLAATVTMRSEAGTRTTTRSVTLHAARRSGGKKPKGRKKRGH